MAGFPNIVVRQPQPHDIIDDPIKIAGLATGFEAQISVRVRDANGNELVATGIRVGANGVLANFHAEVALPGLPPTVQGTLEVFEVSAKGDGSELNRVSIPIIFGRALVNPYTGFLQHTVVRGETLSGIAQKWYHDGMQWRRIFEANRQQITDPDKIFPGQVLRIPV